LRRRQNQQPLLKSEFDQIAQLLAKGALSDARATLDKIEATAR
jgi:hypothetical protein